jgi:hypothetical protein
MAAQKAHQLDIQTVRQKELQKDTQKDTQKELWLELQTVDLMESRMELKLVL